MKRCILLFAVFLVQGAAHAGSTCNSISVARMESAQALLEGLKDVPDSRKAMQVERARILLEKTLKEDAACEPAKTLRGQADRIFVEIEHLSSDAAAEETLLRATSLVQALEAATEWDPAEVQATRFLIAALADRLPGDVRVPALAKRAANLGGEK